MVFSKLLILMRFYFYQQRFQLDANVEYIVSGSVKLLLT